MELVEIALHSRLCMCFYMWDVETWTLGLASHLNSSSSSMKNSVPQIHSFFPLCFSFWLFFFYSFCLKMLLNSAPQMCKCETIIVFTCDQTIASRKMLPVIDTLLSIKWKWEIKKGVAMENGKNERWKWFELPLSFSFFRTDSIVSVFPKETICFVSSVFRDW